MAGENYWKQLEAANKWVDPLLAQEGGADCAERVSEELERMGFKRVDAGEVTMIFYGMKVNVNYSPTGEQPFRVIINRKDPEAVTEAAQTLSGVINLLEDI